MRLFIAVEFDDHVKKELLAVQEKLRPNTTKGKFTPLDNFHLTLYFIGEGDKDSYEEIKTVVKEAAELTAPFELSLNSLGHFPKKEKHIIWMGVKGDLEPLVKLNHYIKQELGIGHPIDDLIYTPHITLGRQIKLGQTFDVLQEKITVPNVPISVSSISLMESRRENGQLVYKPIYNKKLRNDEND